MQVYFKVKAAQIEDFHLIVEREGDIGGLYLGNARCACDYDVLKKEKLAVVLDVAGIDHKYPEGTVAGHKVVKALDSPDFDLSACFEECFEFIDDHRRKGHNVLVHCVAGVSRSATIVIAYLMQSQDIDLWQAQEDVRRIRSVIRPNQGFMNQLKKYEKEIIKRRNQYS